MTCYDILYTKATFVTRTITKPIINILIYRSLFRNYPGIVQATSRNIKQNIDFSQETRTRNVTSII